MRKIQLSSGVVTLPRVVSLTEAAHVDIGDSNLKEVYVLHAGYSRKGEGSPPSYGQEPDVGEGLEEVLDEKLHISSNYKRDE